MRRALGLAAAVAAVRLAAYPFTQSWFGDAFARVDLAEQWAASPHWISAFGDGAWQFGPLHLYLLGLASKLWSVREHACRVVSLVAGVATTFPLFFLCRRLFDERAAVVSCLVFAFWGLHIQFSTTAASEALALLLFATVFACFAAEGWGALIGSAFALTLACATRYDAWLLVPLLGGVLVARRQWARAAAFCAVAALFPAVWMLGNWRMHGDALYPVHYIDAFHRAWFAENDAFWGIWRHRVLNLVFWPAVALFTLTPFVAIAGAVGAWRARTTATWLVVAMLVPAAIFTFRGAVLGDFVPLGRFAGRELLLLIVLAGPVLKQRAVAVLAVFTLCLGAYTWQRESKWANALRPLSPVTTLPAWVMEAAGEARRCDGPVLIASDPGFHDLAIAFYSGLPREQLVMERNGAPSVETRCTIGRH